MPNLNSSLPQSVSELILLISEIEDRQNPLRMGRTSLNTLKNLIEFPARTAVSSISELAELNDVNPSTLSRLAKTLGFTGFSAFQKIFRDHVDRHGNYYSNRATRLLNNYSVDDSVPILNTIIQDEIINLSYLETTLSRSVVESVVDMIINSSKVGFFGRRQFYSLAAFMGYALGLIRNNVELLQPIPDISHSLNFMDQDDLLIVLGCDPYTRATVDVCKIAGELDIPVVAITDSSASPLVQYSKQHLLIPTDGQFYSNSMAASFAMAEGILAMVAQRMGKSAVSNLEKREKLNREFGTTFN